jgi:putative nucleotidyltransferase with HDIG domain
VRAALLHDVGKRHTDIGVVGRVAASLLRLARLPARGQMATYLDHAALGARDLEAVGAEDLVIAFAAHHHEATTPTGVDPAVWAALRRADGE